MLAEAGRAVVGAAGPERGGVEAGDGRPVGSREGDVRAVPSGSRCEIQKTGFCSWPNPAAFHSSNAMITR